MRLAGFRGCSEVVSLARCLQPLYYSMILGFVKGVISIGLIFSRECGFVDLTVAFVKNPEPFFKPAIFTQFTEQ